MYIVYNFALIIYWLLKLPTVVRRILFEDGYKKRLFESGGALSAERKELIADKNAIWLHAASVGEIVAASAVAKEIRKEWPNVPIVVSVVTSTGYEMAKHIIPEAEDIIYFPLDLPFSTQRMLDLVDPSIIVIVETEIWPNFIHKAKQKNIPILMVNGRISDKSIEGYRKVKFFMKAILKNIDYFCMQSQIDATYIKELGADPAKVVVTGNTKYDSFHPDVEPQDIEKLKRTFGTEGKYPVIVAGSTHTGEESMVIDAFNRLLKKEPNAKLIVAPRHVNRSESIYELFAKKGHKAVLRSTMTEEEAKNAQVIIVDTIGELGRVYAISDIVFVGGSLVPVGGHNILEVAVFGKPIIVGPHMFNFKDIYALLSRNGGCVTVENDGELSKQFIELSENKEYREALGNACLAIMEENRGASRKNVLEIRRLLKESNRLSRVEG